MGVAWYWARAELRTRWRAWLAVALLVGIGGGAAMGAIAGARRTQGAYPALLEWADPPDLVVDPDFDRGSSDLFLEALADVPGVAHRSDARAVALGVVTDGMIDVGSVGSAVASVDGDRFYRRDRVLVREGRMPDPASEGEVLVSESVAVEGVAVGDRLDLRALAVDDVFEAYEAGGEGVPADLGQPAPVVVTGIGAFPETAVADPDLAQDRILVTPALYRALPATSRLWDRTGVHLAEGADVEAVRREIQDLAAELGGTALFEVRADITERAQRSLRPYVLALAGLGAAGALFVALSGWQLVRRLTAQAEGDRRILHALAPDRRTQRLAAALPAGIVAVGAAAIAATCAVAVAARTPVGPVRGLADVAGSPLDPLVLGPGLVVVLAIGLLPALSAGRGVRPAHGPTTGMAVEWARQGGAPLPVVLGVGSATGTGGSQRRSVARSGIATVALAVGMLVAIATFSASLTRVLDHPEMHGWNADVALLGQDGYGTFDLRAAAEVEGAASMAGAVFGSFAVGDADVAGLGIVPLRGEWFPPMVAGRPPAGPDEVLLGQRSLEVIGAAVGDVVDVRMPGDAASRPMRVSGTAIFPGLGQLDNDRPTLGDGVLVVLPDEAIEEIGMGWSAVFADLEPGADRDAVIADLVERSDEVLGSTEVIELFRPADIASFARLGFVPALLLGIFAAVAVGSLLHVLLVAARSRRRDRAVLAALGAAPGQLRSAARWHALTVVALALVVAVPAGIALGRWSWRTLALDIGVVPDPVLPLPALAALVAALLLIAVAATALPERLHRAERPGPHLRAE